MSVAISERAAATAAAPTPGRARAYLYWSAWIALAFFAVYPTTNWLASRAPFILHLYLPAELAVPFVPQFIWAYVSMYVLFLLPVFVLPAARMPVLGKQLIAGTLASGVLFIALPAELGFARVLPADPFYARLYAALFSVDRPYNLVPSLHLVFSGAICLACAQVSPPLMRAALLVWLAAISVSTVLVHQHHLIDLAAAFAVVYVLRRTFRGENA